MQLGRTVGALFLLRCLRITRGCLQYVELQEDPQDSDAPDSDSGELQGVGAKRTRIKVVFKTIDFKILRVLYFHVYEFHIRQIITLTQLRKLHRNNICFISDLQFI